MALLGKEIHIYVCFSILFSTDLTGMGRLVQHCCLTSGLPQQYPSRKSINEGLSPFETHSECTRSCNYFTWWLKVCFSNQYYTFLFMFVLLFPILTKLQQANKLMQIILNSKRDTATLKRLSVELSPPLDYTVSKSTKHIIHRLYLSINS